MAMVDVDDNSHIGGLTAQVDWLVLRVGGHLALNLHSSHEPGKLSKWCYAMMTAPLISSCNYHYYYYYYEGKITVVRTMW